jgi:hypothetical protein
MLNRSLRRGLGIAGFVLWAWAVPAPAAQTPLPPSDPTREELLREIRRLDGEIQRLQSQIDLLRRAALPQASAVITVPAGARQGTSFNQPAPSLGPSDWVPAWPPVRSPSASPQARERLPAELGAPPPPLDAPLDFPQFVPGTVRVRHGLGPNEVTVTLEMLNPDGSTNLQVDGNRLAARASYPPDGTFTILNYFEFPVTVRWVARRSPD